MANRSYKIDDKAILFMLLMVAFFGFPAIKGAFFTSHEARSVWEGRALAELPRPGFDLQEWSDVPVKTDAYLQDHFGFAVSMNKAYRMMTIEVLAETKQDNITVGEDGFLFLSDYNTDDRYSRLRSLCQVMVNPRHTEIIVPPWLALLEQFSARGYEVTLGIAPSKPGLYPDKLPDSVPAELRKACLAYGSRLSSARVLARSAAEAGFRVIYPYDEFAAAKDSPNFYPGENFHWKGQSTHLFAELLFDAVGISVDERFSAQQTDIFAVSDVSNMLGYEVKFKMRIFDYSTFGIRHEKSAPEYMAGYFQGNWSPIGYMTTAHAMSERSALVVGNSFTTDIVTDLAPGYTNILWFLTNTTAPEDITGLLETALKNFQPDDIIFITHDNALHKANMLLQAIVH